MQYHIRYLTLICLLFMTISCVKNSLSPDVFVTYKIGVAYYHSGSYQVESIIHSNDWQFKPDNVWMAKMYDFHVQATLSQQTGELIYTQQGLCSDWDYYELQVNPDKPQAFESELLIYVYGATKNPGKLIFSQKYQGSSTFVELSIRDFAIEGSSISRIRKGRPIVDSFGVKHPVIHLYLNTETEPGLVTSSTIQKDNPLSTPKQVMNNFIQEENILPEPLPLQEKPPYQLGFYSKLGHAHISGAIGANEWKQYNDYFQARLFTFEISALSADGQVIRTFNKQGFANQSSQVNDRFILDFHQQPKNSVPLIVRVYGFSERPSSLKFFQKLSTQGTFFEMTKDSFFIDNKPPKKWMITQKIQKQRGDYPVVNIYYNMPATEPVSELKKDHPVMIRTIIEDYENVSFALKEQSYLEYLNNEVIIQTLPVTNKELQLSFAPDNIPTNVRLQMHRKSLVASKVGDRVFRISLSSVTQKVIVQNKQNLPITQAIVRVYANHKVSTRGVKQKHSFFSALQQLFSTPSEQFVQERIALYSGKTNPEGIFTFIDLGYPIEQITLDIFKPGFQLKENLSFISFDYPLVIPLEPRIKSLKTARFIYGICMNEASDIHQSKGQLEIYDNGQLCAILPPKSDMILPLTRRPVYRFKHPDYTYHEILPDESGWLQIIPKNKIQRPQDQIQVLLIIDATDDDPKGVEFLKTVEAVVRYLKHIQWDQLPITHKNRIKVASAYQEHLNYFSHTRDIDHNALMSQADSSLTDQLKKAFSQFDPQMRGVKKVVYMVSSNRASVIVDDNLTSHLTNGNFLNNQKVFNAIVVGTYGGKGLKNLAATTNGQFAYCKTSDDIFNQLNDIVGSLSNQPQIIPCSGK